MTFLFHLSVYLVNLTDEPNVSNKMLFDCCSVKLVYIASDWKLAIKQNFIFHLTLFLVTKFAQT